MKFERKWIILLAAFFLAGASAAWPAQTQTPSKPATAKKAAKAAKPAKAENEAEEKGEKAEGKEEGKTHRATGTVVSISDTGLALSHKVKGKEAESTFVIEKETKMAGKVEKGARVTVFYHMEDGKKEATRIKAHEAAAAAAGDEAKPKAKAKAKAKPKAKATT